MAKYYIAIIDYADDGAFGAYFPDAPGCTAMGTSEEEVISNATDALSEWAADERAEGRAMSLPRPYAELLKSGAYGLGENGLIATIPLILETGKLARANISIDAGLLADIDEASSKARITRSAFIAAAARERLKRRA